MSSERYVNRWRVGEWTFYRIEDHPFTEHQGEPLFGFGPVGSVRSDGRPETGEWYPSLEHAMVAAVGEKYTGKRSAGGSGVATAADWFMRMIGAETLTALGRDEAEKAAGEVVAGLRLDLVPETTRQDKHRVKARLARWMVEQLAARGVVLSAVNHGR